MTDFMKTGYLNEDFRFFYNKDAVKREFPLHYHDFHKIIYFFRGNLLYQIEEKRYDLQAGDIVIVKAGDIHKPIILDETVYERAVFYVSEHFFENYRDRGADFSMIFDASKVIRPNTSCSNDLVHALPLFIPQGLDDGLARLFRQAKTAEFLTRVASNLLSQDSGNAADFGSLAAGAVTNPLAFAVMQHIGEHLHDPDLDVDHIASSLCLSRSYMMHIFKAATGTTIVKYITDKRLFNAACLIKEGRSVSDACWESGFGSYSAFYHAWTKKYRNAPGANRSLPDKNAGRE